MSDIKKIKDEFLHKLNADLNIESINQIKSELFGKNGKISSSFKNSGIKKKTNIPYLVDQHLMEKDSA